MHDARSQALGDGSGRPRRVAAWLVGAMVVLPFWFVAFPPLADYPNHLARLYILTHYHEVAAFQRDFAVTLRLLPNLGVEAIGLPIMRVIGDPFVAGRVILCLTALLFVLGCHAAGWAALGRGSWRGTITGLLFYSSSLLYGFLNFLVASALFLAAFAAWYGWRRRWTAWRLVASSALMLAAFFAHLSALGFLGATVVAATGADLLRSGRRDWKAATLDLLPLVPLAVAFKAFPAGSGTGQVWWPTLVSKLSIFASPLRTYWLGFDVMVVVGLIVILALLVRRATNVRVRWPMAAASVALLAAAIASPRALFGGTMVDVRFVVPACCLAPFALEADVRSRGFYAGGLLGVLLVRVAAILSVWSIMSGQAAAAVALLERLPRESRLLVSFIPQKDPGLGEIDEYKNMYAFAHVACYATLTRHVVTSNMFAYSYQPIAYRDPRMSTDWKYRPDDPRTLRELYPFTWTWLPPPETRQALAEGWRRLAQSGNAELWARSGP